MNRVSGIDLEALAARNVHEILTRVMKHPQEASAVVVSDDDSLLARLLSAAYATGLPRASQVRYHNTPREELLGAFSASTAGDLVVLIQSTSFRMEGFRIRVELLKRGLKVIEHSNLRRITDAEVPCYLDALAYDPDYYVRVGNALRDRINQAKGAVIDSGGARLTFDSPFESAKLNTGDFSTLKNVASTFPIGEVFTEAQHLDRVNGLIRIHAFSDTGYVLNAVETPITMIIEAGRVVGTVDSTPAFDHVLAAIRADEGTVFVRELGFGMNRAFSRDRRVSDVGAYERVCGIHLSLGAKHGVYKKPGFRHKEAKYHLDVFAVTERVLLDDEVVFSDGAWTV